MSAGRRPDVPVPGADECPRITSELGAILACARCLDGVIVGVLAFENDIELARRLVCNLDRVLDRDSYQNVNHGLKVARDQALGLIEHLTVVLERGGEPRLGPSRGGPLILNLESVYAHAHGVGVSSLEQRRACNIAPSAGRLLAAAARMLPIAVRARYSDEYRSELWEIAYEGAGRRQQVRYAVRQLTRVAQLRGAVMTPRRRNAS